MLIDSCRSAVILAMTIGIVAAAHGDPRNESSTSEPGNEGKTASILIDAQMRQNAIGNVERHDWARDRKEGLAEAVAPYMRMDKQELWELLPSQEMGRSRYMYFLKSSTADHRKGCPQCYLDHGGEDVGTDRHHIELLDRPWQVQCARCGTWLPKNDFEAYYESSLDETGRFRIGEGDPEHLEPREDVEGEARHWVDDGTGVEFDGYTWFFSNLYATALWKELASVAEKMGELYTLTEDSRYARRAAVILDRMADFYPEMNEEPGRELGMWTIHGPGRVTGDYEYHWIRVPAARAYDYIYDAIQEDSELVAFLDRMTREYAGPDKSSFEAIDEHIRENLLVEFIEDIIENPHMVERGQAQSALGTVAVALDDPERTPQYLDWMFREEGGRLPVTLIDEMNRDGFGAEMGFSYMTMPTRGLHGLAMALERYEGSDHSIFDYPNFMNAFTALSRARVLDKAVPVIGDTFSSMQMLPYSLHLPIMVDAYRVYGTEAIAREIHLLLESDPDRAARGSQRRAREMHQTEEAFRPIVREGIYEAEPEALAESIQSHLDEAKGPLESYNAGGVALAALQAPWREDGRAAMINYSRTMSNHAHADRLSLHLWAFDEVMMPDLGRPESMGRSPKRHGWMRHTLSHNTLMVNDTHQGSSYSGKTRLFADAGPVRVADIDGIGKQERWHRWSGQVYENVDTYRRAVVMVDVDETNSYLLDLFWARGGENHRLIQNSGSPEATHEGLATLKQERGTFAGEDVEFGEFYDYDGDVFWSYGGSGFQYLKNVERDVHPPESFRIDWPIDPRYDKPDDWQAHMRLHNLTQVDEVALAHGQTQPGGHPDKIRYSLRSRLGEDLHSQFISVIEPYMHEPFIEDVRVLERVENEFEPFAAAVEVNLVDGRRDVLLVRKESGELSVDDVHLDGRVGLARYDANGELEKLVAIAAAELRAGDEAVEAAPVRGEFEDHDDSDPRNVKVRLRRNDPLSEDLVGKYVIFDNNEFADGSYRIEGIEDERTLNIGQMPLYERLRDPDDFDAGVVYNIMSGEPFIIPRTAVWQR